MVEKSQINLERAHLLARLNDAQTQQKPFDVLIIGGGATGLGIALDAALRGFSVALMESHDFAKGTSSRATKLVHGGVRYLAQGNIGLVKEALHERTTLLANAPHLTQSLSFVIACYKWWQTPYYAAGLTAYDMLAGKAGLGKTQMLNTSQVQQYLPTVQTQHLVGGVQYWDGQFNDARLALALARTALQQGAVVLNYCPVKSLMHHQGKVCGVVCEDALSGKVYQVGARCVINATGVWVDDIRAHDNPELEHGPLSVVNGIFNNKNSTNIGYTGQNSSDSIVNSAKHQHGKAQRIVTPSQGAHVVVDRSFLPTNHALMIPKTSDGRVLFAVPWLGYTILGTTDSERKEIEYEPQAFKSEIDFILNESANYLAKSPKREDVKSVWVGLRPLVKVEQSESVNTKALSREHTILCSKTGLITITGGKWTTYRAMAEDTLARCMDEGLLPKRNGGLTAHFPLVGAQNVSLQADTLSKPYGLHAYGNEAGVVEAMQGSQVALGEGITEAMVRFAARYEYAQTVEDVLARRTRLLFLDAKQAAHIAPRVAHILQEELQTPVHLEQFLELAQLYAKVP